MERAPRMPGLLLLFDGAAFMLSVSNTLPIRLILACGVIAR